MKNENAGNKKAPAETGANELNVMGVLCPISHFFRSNILQRLIIAVKLLITNNLRAHAAKGRV